MGEGLRNTISLRGRAGAQGFLHWSANFDEVQDFEGQIRSLAGGSGLMTDAAFNTGTRSQPLGLAKAGQSADLDALAAYVTSLSSFSNSPRRNVDGSLTAAATAGREVFRAENCAQCHSGTAFTSSAAANLRNIGTLKPSSGKRLNGALTGIDTPTLRDVWATAPYLHDGSAPTLMAAIVAHSGVTVSGTNLSNLVAYVEQIGAQETSAPIPDTTAPSTPGGFTLGQSNGRPALSWSASTDNIALAGYIIYRSTNGAAGPEVARATARTWTDTTSKEGVKYTYAVKAYDTSGNLSASTALKSVTAYQIPTTPGALTVSLVGGDPRLKWNAATDNVGVTGYAIYRSTNGGTGSEIVRTSSLTWTDTSARAGTRYTYNVRAYDAAGYLSDRSTLVSIKAQ
jgi:chitodextrinase